MSYTIYVDDTLFLNCTINYFLLLSSQLLSGIPFRRYRILLSSLFASLYSLFALLPALSSFYIIPFRFAAALLFSFFATGFCKRALRSGVLFILLSFLFGGMVSAFTWITHSSSILTLSRGVYLPSTLRVATVISVLLYYIILRFFKHLLPLQGAKTMQITLQNEKGDYPLSLLLDSGSRLYDVSRNTPIPVVAKESLKQYFTEEEYLIITSCLPVEAFQKLTGSPHHFGLIPIITAGGNQLLLTFRSRVRYEYGESFSPTLVAISEGSISPADGFDGVIGL